MQTIYYWYVAYGKHRAPNRSISKHFCFDLNKLCRIMRHIIQRSVQINTATLLSLLLLFFLHSRGLLFVLWPRTFIILGLLLPLFSNFFAFNFQAIQLMPEPNVEKRQIDGLLHLGNAYFYRYFFFTWWNWEHPNLDAFEATGCPRRVSSSC